jgi:hypothetical protein
MKLYTKADAEKAVKVLFFEGAGCAERGDVENCRIRTAFTNDEGKGIYLELCGMEVNHKSPERWKKYLNAGFVDYCHYTEQEQIERIHSGTGKVYYEYQYKTIKEIENGLNFEYSKQGILNFVNENLNCSFDEIKILDSFDGYRVHKDGGGYNFIEDFEYKPEIASARRNAYNKIDMQIREQLCEKYSKISLHDMNDESITVRVYASDQSMQAHGMDPKQRKITVQL